MKVASLVDGMATTPICDIRFTIQRGFASVDLRRSLAPFGVTNNIVMLPGDALLAANNIDIEPFIESDISIITAALESYLCKYKIDPDTCSLAVINIEAKDSISDKSYSPANLHEWTTDPRWDQIIEGYSYRIAVARKVLPNAKISLFQVVKPLNKGCEDTCGNQEIFSNRIDALVSAGSLGMFDQLDYFSPPCYLRFDSSTGGGGGTRDDEMHWNNLSLRQAIETSLTITNSSGNNLPLAPFLSFWFITGQPHPVASAESIKRQLQTMREYSGIDTIVFWTGSENINLNKFAPVRFIDFFTDVNSYNVSDREFPRVGC